MIFMSMDSSSKMAALGLKQKRVLVAVVIGILGLLFLYHLSRNSPDPTYSPGTCLHHNQKAVRLSELIAASIDLSHRGGDEVRAVRRGRSGIGQEVKGKSSVDTDDFVTLGDKRSHEAIVAGLRARWRDLKYISEEHVEVDPSFVACPSMDDPEIEKSSADDPFIPLEDVLVWIDPLDATQEYTEGGKDVRLLEYVTVMMCVCVRGEPVAGVIHQAFEGNTGNGETYWGWKGHGFSTNIWPLVDMAKTQARGKDVEKERVDVVVSRSHAGKATEELEGMFQQGVDVTAAAGAGYKVLQVVNGHTDLYYHSTYIKKWDLCAGDAMLRTAGGKMTTRTGEVLKYNEGDPLNKDGVLASLDHHDWYLKKAKLP